MPGGNRQDIHQTSNPREPIMMQRAICTVAAGRAHSKDSDTAHTLYAAIPASAESAFSATPLPPVLLKSVKSVSHHWNKRLDQFLHFDRTVIIFVEHLPSLHYLTHQAWHPLSSKPWTSPIRLSKLPIRDMAVSICVCNLRIAFSATRDKETKRNSKCRKS